METLVKESPEKLGFNLNEARTSDTSFLAPKINEYGVMKVTNIATGQFLGYMGTAYNQYADIVSDIKEAAKFKWCSSGSELYLEKQTDPNDRYLGVGAQN